MKNSKDYILAFHVISEYHSTMAMFSKSDDRLKNKTDHKQGTFTSDKSIKGLINGHEKGVFVCDNGDKYIVFSDNSVLKYKLK